MGASTDFTEEAAEAAFLFFAGREGLAIVAAAAGGRGLSTTTGLVVGIGFAAVDGAGGGLGFFLGEASGKGFVGAGVGLGGVGVVGAEVSCFFGWVGGAVVASGVRRRTIRGCASCYGGLGGVFVLCFAGDGVYVVAGWR